MDLTSLKAKILLSVIIAVVVIEGIFLYLNITIPFSADDRKDRGRGL